MKKRGFIVKYTLIKASDLGAYHKRLRWYCLCYKPYIQLPSMDTKDFDWDKIHKIEDLVLKPQNKKYTVTRCARLGNSIVPQCAIHAWNHLVKGIPIPQKDPKLQIVLTDGKTTIHKTLWATPVFSVWRNYKKLTDRGSRLLCNQVYYHKDNTIADKANHNKEYVANPIFVEALMGYPKNWTKY